MEKYEVALVVDAKVDEEVRQNTLETVKNYISRFGGTVTSVDEWGKKKLAYEIQKKTEGYYYFIYFESESETPGQLEQRLRIMDNVLRYLCIKQEA